MEQNMANPLSPGDILRVRVWTRYTAAQAAVNTLHYKVSAVGASPGTDLDVANYLDNQFANPYKACISTICEYRGVQCQVLQQVPPYKALTTAAVANANAGFGLGGTSANAPTQCCGLISIYSGRAGQAGRGRMYIAFPTQSDIAPTGRFTSAYITLL